MLYVQMTGDFDRKPHLFSSVNDSMLSMSNSKDNVSVCYARAVFKKKIHLNFDISLISSF